MPVMLWGDKMNWMLETMFITGVTFGIEWMPLGRVCDDEGYVVIDIFIVRFLITYSPN
jgi:hypothetical protein